MPFVAIMDVRETLEAGRKSLAHGCFAFETFAPRLWATRHIERAIICKELHDRVEIVGVEGIKDGSQGVQRRCGHAGSPQVMAVENLWIARSRLDGRMLANV